MIENQQEQKQEQKRATDYQLKTISKLARVLHDSTLYEEDEFIKNNSGEAGRLIRRLESEIKFRRRKI